MEQDGLLETAPLTKALYHTADTYDQIALLCEDQPRLDFEPMGDLLHDYRGLLASFPDIITVHKVSCRNYFGQFKTRNFYSSFFNREHFKNDENWNARQQRVKQKTV